jgi:hypothetical protein
MDIVLVHEVVGVLDASKAKIIQLDITLETIREAMASEHRKEIQQIEKTYREEIERKLQI